MVLLMTCQIAFVMAVAIRATLVMVALMMRVRSALRCMPVMVRTVLPHRGCPGRWPSFGPSAKAGTLSTQDKITAREIIFSWYTS